MKYAIILIATAFPSLSFAQQAQNQQTPQVKAASKSQICSGQRCIDVMVIDAQCRQAVAKDMQTVAAQQTRRACVVEMLGGPIMKFSSSTKF